MMQPKEIAALYNHIRKTKGYGRSARTEIAGMLFEASKASKKKISNLEYNKLRISRIGNDDSLYPVWYIDFNLTPIRPSQEVFRQNDPCMVSISFFKPIPNSINKCQSSRTGIMSYIKVLVICKLNSMTAVSYACFLRNGCPMKREELAALYTCINANGLRRAEIAGMLFQMLVIPKQGMEYGKYKSYVINIYRVHEKGPEWSWSIEFTADPIRFSIGNAILIDLSPSNIAPTYVDIVDIHFYGNEDSRKHDCTLLRMFASEWGGDCETLG